MLTGNTDFSRLDPMPPPVPAMCKTVDKKIWKTVVDPEISMVRVTFRVLFLTLVLCAGSLKTAHASFMYIDFDGSGFGSSYSSSSAPAIPSAVCVSGCGGGSSESSSSYTYNGTLGIPRGHAAEDDNRRLRELQNEILRKQKEEAERREKEARVRHLRVEQFLELERQEEKDEEKIRERLKFKLRIPQDVSEFEKQQAQEREHLRRLYERIAAYIDQIKVPPPPIPAHYDSVLLLGTGNSPEEADDALKDGFRNPFTNKLYGNIFAFGKKGFVNDLVRSVEDHFLAEGALLSPQTMRNLGKLRGARVKEVVAHSNGATVAEVLIRKGVIKGVKKFIILGGDRSLMNIDSLQQLATDKHIEVFVYANKGDIVPMIPVGWQIREMVEKVGPLQQYKLAESLTYQVMGLRHPDSTTKSAVKVQLFSIPPAWTSIADKHVYANYHRLINARRLQGCLESTGVMDARCRF